MARPTAAIVAAGTIVVVLATSVGSRALDGPGPPSWMRSPAPAAAAPTTAPPSTTSRPPLLGGRPGHGEFGPATAAPTPEGTATSVAVPPSPEPASEPPPGPVPAPPAIVARPQPPLTPAPAPPPAAAPSWSDTTRRTPAGYLATDVGCAGGTSAGALDAFFAARRGPAIGFDYQHVYPLGGDRYLWLFQDTFLDHGGGATRLDQASFVHNAAMVQEGACFTLLHHGRAEAPSSFEQGQGEQTLRTWFWPMGGELVGDTLYVFWAQMRRTADPNPGDGLGWDPVATWLAAYDADSLARTSFRRAPDAGVHPIYGYAVASDTDRTYLFGNSFDQNLGDQGGFFGGPHSARLVFLARVPRGRLDHRPEYWTGAGWSAASAAATPISDRFSPENPMQPRHLDGQWVAATKVGGYWGEELVIDIADQPWGPWQQVVRRPLAPRGADALMNTYHAHLMPWVSGGALVISVSQNARDMLAHAWPRPDRYRPQFTTAPLVRPPPVVSTTTTSSSTSTTTTSTSTTTTTPPTTTTTTTATTTTTTSTSTTTTTPPTTTTTPTTTSTTSPSSTAAPCPSASTSTSSTSTTSSPSTPSSTSTTSTTSTSVAPTSSVACSP